MSGKQVSLRMGLSQAIVDLLVSKNLSATNELLSSSDLELVQELNLPYEEVCQILSKVRKKLVPNSKTIQDLLSERECQITASTLRTRLCLLDAYLRGGIAPDGITEIVGAPGVGKTQFCYMLLVLATLPEELGGLGRDRSIIYFESENSFSPTRLVQLCTFLAPDYFLGYDEIAQALDRIIHIPIQNSRNLLDALEDMEEFVISKRVKAIIIDSIAAIIQKEFDGSKLAKRQHLLNFEASKLKELAAKFHMPIIVTNQVMSSGMSTHLNNIGKISTPALGVLWSHCVNTRIVMEYSRSTDFNIPPNLLPALIRISIPKQNNQVMSEVAKKITINDDNDDPYDEDTQLLTIRRMTIAKSPVSPVVSFPYIITRQGLCLIKTPQFLSTHETIGNLQSSQESELDYYILETEPSNYWNQIVFDVYSSANLPPLNANNDI